MHIIRRVETSWATRVPCSINVPPPCLRLILFLSNSGRTLAWAFGHRQRNRVVGPGYYTRIAFRTSEVQFVPSKRDCQVGSSPAAAVLETLFQKRLIRVRSTPSYQLRPLTASDNTWVEVWVWFDKRPSLRPAYRGRFWGSVPRVARHMRRHGDAEILRPCLLLGWSEWRHYFRRRSS